MTSSTVLCPQGCYNEPNMGGSLPLSACKRLLVRRTSANVSTFFSCASCCCCAASSCWRRCFSALPACLFTSATCNPRIHLLLRVHDTIDHDAYFGSGASAASPRMHTCCTASTCLIALCCFCRRSKDPVSDEKEGMPYHQPQTACDSQMSLDRPLGQNISKAA